MGCVNAASRDLSAPSLARYRYGPRLACRIAAEDSEEQITSRAPEDERQSDPEVQFACHDLPVCARRIPFKPLPARTNLLIRLR